MGAKGVTRRAPGALVWSVDMRSMMVEVSLYAALLPSGRHSATWIASQPPESRPFFLTSTSFLKRTHAAKAVSEPSSSQQ